MLYLVCPHRVEPKGPCGGALRSTYSELWAEFPAAGIGRSLCRWRLDMAVTIL